MLYFGKALSSAAMGVRLKTVDCEKCATLFHYQMARKRTASSHAPYGVGQDKAQQKAQQSAERKLEESLEHDVELVPCPKCKWVNTASIRIYRKSRYRGLFTLSIVSALLGFLVISLIFANPTALMDDPRAGLSQVMIIAAILVLMTSAAPLLAQAFLRRRINPNRHVNGHPNIPAGTPPAILERTAGKFGPEFVTVASTPAEPNGWALFRPGQLVMDPLCCMCLAPATHSYRMPMSNKNKLKPPLCQRCLQRARRKWLALNLTLTPLAFIAIWCLGGLSRDIDEVGRWILAIIGGCVLAAIAFAAVDEALRPYRLKTVDRTRNIYKIRFSNPAYTARIRRRVAEADGLER